jgi:hypothetical protein
VTRASGGPGAREWQLFAVGTGLVSVHVVDHLLTNPRFGWSLAPAVLLFESATALAVLTLIVAIVHAWLPPWLREAVALSMGFTWLLAASLHHVALMSIRGPEPTDYTGVSAAIGGLALVTAGLTARVQRRRGSHTSPISEDRAPQRYSILQNQPPAASGDGPLYPP